MTALAKPAIHVDLDDLYLDPNNPRLGEIGPGYEDPTHLFRDDVQEFLMEQIESGEHGVNDLTDTILKKGWVPTDSIWVWEHPNAKGKFLVVEGNRRICTLKKIMGDMLPRLDSDVKKVGANKRAIKRLEAQLELINKLGQQIAKIEVKPLATEDPMQLKSDLLELLSVRHINGAREWATVAADTWLLRTYTGQYETKHGSNANLTWDEDLIDKLATDASLTKLACKQKLLSASWNDQFRSEFSSRLPNNEKGERDDFKDSDYYLFELISKNAVFRDDILKCSPEMTEMTPTASEALFEWVFKKPSHKSADDNENIIYAHRNVDQIRKMKLHDNAHGTSFATSLM